MSATTEAVIFDDIFEVQAVDPKGRNFENVTRAVAKAPTFDIDLVVDLHAQFFGLYQRDRFRMAIATTLDLLNSSTDTGVFNQSKKPTLMDKFDYCMYGKIYRIEHNAEKEGEKTRKISVYISNGGLLMKIEGDQKNLKALEMDMSVYSLFQRKSR